MNFNNKYTLDGYYKNIQIKIILN